LQVLSARRRAAVFSTADRSCVAMFDVRTILSSVLVALSAAGCATSSASSDSGASSAASSAASSDSSASSNGNSTANSVQSSANATADSAASRLPSSVQTSDASRPSSDQSSGTTAQSDQSTDQSSQNSSQTQPASTAAPVYSTVGVTTTAGAVAAIIWARSAKPTPRAAEAAQAFLLTNRFQLQEDLALGAGRSIDDLAALARIRAEHLGRFAKLLRAHRAELLELADARALTPDRAVRALRRIGELAVEDPALANDAQLALAALGGAK
jgi:hypothetical protein